MCLARSSMSLVTFTSWMSSKYSSSERTSYKTGHRGERNFGRCQKMRSFQQRGQFRCRIITLEGANLKLIGATEGTFPSPRYTTTTIGEQDEIRIDWRRRRCRGSFRNDWRNGNAYMEPHVHSRHRAVHRG